MGRLRVTQVRSTIDCIEQQKRTMRALGIRRMHQTVEHDDNAAIRGMIERVYHLVQVEEVGAVEVLEDRLVRIGSDPVQAADRAHGAVVGHGRTRSSAAPIRNAATSS